MKTNTIYIFIVSIVLFVIACVGFWYMEFEMNKKIEVVRQYHAQQQQNSNFELEKKLESNIVALKEQENKINKIFLAENSLVSFVQKIEGIAQNNKLTITTEKIDRATTTPAGLGQSVEPIQFSLNISGEYEEIKDFVEQVQDLDTLIMVQDIRLYKGTSELNTEGTQSSEGVPVKSNSAYNARIILSGIILSYD